MPNPTNYTNRNDFMDACMSATKKEGLELKHRLGKCLGMWRSKKGGNSGGADNRKGKA